LKMRPVYWCFMLSHLYENILPHVEIARNDVGSLVLRYLHSSKSPDTAPGPMSDEDVAVHTMSDTTDSRAVHIQSDFEIQTDDETSELISNTRSRQDALIILDDVVSPNSFSGGENLPHIDSPQPSPPENASGFALEDDVNRLEITNHDRTDFDEDDELTEEIVET